MGGDAIPHRQEGGSMGNMDLMAIELVFLYFLDLLHVMFHPELELK